MESYIINFAYLVCQKNESIPRIKKRLWQKLFYNGLKLICSVLIEWILTLKYLFNKQPFKPLIEDINKPIVSLTSFPARINSIWLVINSMFTQTYPPAKVILVLTKSEFPLGISEIPSSIKRFVNEGLEIIFTDDNLRPHNKYYYALSKYKNREVITIDDDQLYWPDTIERLIKLHKVNPTSVCANSVSYIDIDQRIVIGEAEKKLNFNYAKLGLGVCGVLYPINFRSLELFNTDRIQQLSFTADDLWLKAQEILLNIPVVTGDKYCYPLSIIGSQKIRLMKTNVENGENDLQWKQLDNSYKLADLMINED